MTECQGCGAWNDASRARCVLCDTPLAATDEWDAAADPPPLPPLPDGGLATAMPAWLREPPQQSVPAPAAGTATPPLTQPDPALPSLGPRADPRTFLSDEDFPQWLRDLAARSPATGIPSANAVARNAGDAGVAPTEPPVWATPASPAFQNRDLPLLPGPPPREDGRQPAAAVPRASTERRERGVWETVLLVLLFLGVVVAAVWALLSNGLLGGL